MSKQPFDLKRISHNRDRAASKIARYDHLLKYRAQEMMEYLDIFRPGISFEKILEINGYHGLLTEKILTKTKEMHCADFSLRMLDINKKKIPLSQHTI